MAWVEHHNEVRRESQDGGWVLCFQRCTYHYDDATLQTGYRFIWRRPDGTLQAARGQARIPDAAALQELVAAATREGWFK